MTRPRIGDEVRRRRIGVRHGLDATRRFDDVVTATRAMTVLHATDPATVYASLAARIDQVTVADIDRALYEDRTIAKQMAMRRTIFVFPRELLPAAWGSASARVAGQLRPRMIKDLDGAGIDGARWLADAEQAVIDHLAAAGEYQAAQIRGDLPELAGRVRTNVGKKYEAVVSFAPRVLTQLWADAKITRGHNVGHWRLSRPNWTAMKTWFDDVPESMGAREGYAALVDRWLRTFGPGTRDDIKWWLGSTVAAVRQALDDLGAVEVDLDDGATGWVHADDVASDDDAASAEWAALLPALDPTVMGWKQRGFYLEPELAVDLFDSVGNGGNTAWWAGRAIGTWVQDDSGQVHVVVHPDAEIPSVAHDALAVESERLTAWLDGVIVSTVWVSPAMRSARAALPAH